MARDLHLPIFATAAAAACSAPPPDVLLVTVDTTRADAVGAYGATPSPTPAFDALAAAGIRADEAMSVTPLTLPAHTSILTGLTPDHHGVRDNHDGFVPASAVTLAERLSDAGWQTGAFVGAIVLEESFGLGQGFDAYDDGFDLSGVQAPTLGVLSRPGDVVTDRALAWLDAADPGRPVFLWVHLFDAHQPYTAPPAATARFPDDPYAAEIAHADDQLARLLAAFAGRRAGTLAVVAGDHGEGRGDHGEETHGTFVYRSTMRVPLVFAGPGLAPAVLRAPVSLVDVTPTVLDVLGLPPLATTDGASLVPYARGGPPPARPVVGETWFGRLHFGHADLHVQQDDTWRYVLAPRPELYAWRDDPGEHTNVIDAHPGVAAAFREVLVARTASTATLSPVDPRTRAALTALGYVGGTSLDPDASFADLPDPKDHPDMVRVLEALIVAARTRPPAEAVPLVERFLADHPDVPAARHLLATALELSGRPDAAFDALAPLHGDDAVLLGRRAELLLAAGRDDEALTLLDAAIVTQPSYVLPWAVKAELLRRAGDCDAARRVVEDGLRAATGTAALRVVRGACLDAAGDLAAAEADYVAVLAEAPADPNASALLVRLLARTGRAEAALPVAVAWHAAFPTSLDAAVAVGMTRYELGDFAGTVDALAPRAADPGLGPHGLLALADARLRLGAPSADVHALLDAAATRGAATSQVHRLRAAVYMAEGRPDEALVEMARAAEPPATSP